MPRGPRDPPVRLQLVDLTPGVFAIDLLVDVSRSSWVPIHARLAAVFLWSPSGAQGSHGGPLRRRGGTTVTRSPPEVVRRCRQSARRARVGREAASETPGRPEQAEYVRGLTVHAPSSSPTRGRSWVAASARRVGGSRGTSSRIESVAKRTAAPPSTSALRAASADRGEERRLARRGRSTTSLAQGSDSVRTWPQVVLIERARDRSQLNRPASVNWSPWRRSPRPLATRRNEVAARLLGVERPPLEEDVRRLGELEPPAARPIRARSRGTRPLRRTQAERRARQPRRVPPASRTA